MVSSKAVSSSTGCLWCSQSDIARDATVSFAPLSRHFRDKHAQLDALPEHDFNRLAASLDEEIRGVATTPAEA
jgi:hypothetical protein